MPNVEAKCTHAGRHARTGRYTDILAQAPSTRTVSGVPRELSNGYGGKQPTGSSHRKFGDTERTVPPFFLAALNCTALQYHLPRRVAEVETRSSARPNPANTMLAKSMGNVYSMVDNFTSDQASSIPRERKTSASRAEPSHPPCCFVTRLLCLFVRLALNGLGARLSRRPAACTYIVRRFLSRTKVSDFL